MNHMLASILFVGSVSLPASRSFLSKYIYARSQAGQNDDNIIQLADIDDINQNQLNIKNKNNGSIKRNDSEFSLGLTRSNSFDNIATSLGPLCIFPLCDTGEAIWKVSERVAKCIVILSVAKVLYETSGKSLNGIWKK